MKTVNTINGSFDISYQGQMMVAAGHANDDNLREEFVDTVEVNFIAFLSEDKDIYIVQIDTLFIDDTLRVEIQNELLRNDIPIVFICVASHSHSLPGIDPGKPALGDYNKNYRDFLKQKIVENITKCVKNKDHKQISFSNYKRYSHLSIGRRGSKSKNNFSLLRLRNTVPDFSRLGAYIELTCFWDTHKTRILAIIWTFPAPPVLYPEKNKFSADFPGRVRDLLRKELNDEFLTVLFFPGCAGDMRPLTKSQTKQKKVLDFIVGQSFVECDIDEYEEYCVSLKNELNKCIEFIKNEESNKLLTLIDYQESRIQLEKFGISNRSNKYLRVEL